MQRRAESTDPDTRSRPTSRRNSASTTRRRSVKEVKTKSPPESTSSTPKKVVNPPLDLMVTGRQILKKSDRTNSLPGTFQRCPSGRTSNVSKDSRRRVDTQSKCHNTLEDEFSLDLSQVSDFEDTNSKYGQKPKFCALATSTPRSDSILVKGTGSVQRKMGNQKLNGPLSSLDSTHDSFSISRDSYKTTSSASYRFATDLDCSSVSPDYSVLSSAEPSPRAPRTDEAASPNSQDLDLSSGCVSSTRDCSEVEDTTIAGGTVAEGGEWTHFWANYNNSVAKVPMRQYYDHCPTPYWTEDMSHFSTNGSRNRSPEKINDIICREGLQLTPRETQNIIKCAHILNNVLSKAIERKANEEITSKTHEEKSEIEHRVVEKKRTMTLDLKETNIPLEVKEEKRCETVTTQTDISLPNTKSAPIIFENILRQLSKSSIDENDERVEENKESKQ